VGAEKIAKRIKNEHKSNPREPVQLITHSHGGNVAILVANKLAKKNIRVQNLVTIGTTVRGYQLNRGNTVMRHINVYNTGDVVQVNGGSIWKLGAAGRIFSGATNIQVPALRNSWGIVRPIESHSYMHSNVALWRKYIAPKINRRK
jgi:triacylglycerol esterase/lipase EstA (alpha/beta hydrolase family)